VSVYLRSHEPSGYRRKRVAGMAHWQAGVELPKRTFGPVTLTDIVRYQGASGDMNPMHHDDALARSAGYPEAFGVGMLNAGYLATYCTDIFGTDTVRRFRTRFHGLVWRGETLVATGHVQDVLSEDGRRRVVVDLALATEEGRVVVDGSAEFDLIS
jgi:acyl dehydratase